MDGKGAVGLGLADGETQNGVLAGEGLGGVFGKDGEKFEAGRRGNQTGGGEFGGSRWRVARGLGGGEDLEKLFDGPAPTAFVAADFGF